MAKKAKRKRAGGKKAATKPAESTDGVPVFSDGRLKFCVEGGQSDGKSFRVDMLDVQIVSDELALKHRLGDRKGKPSREFLADLAGEFDSLIGNDIKCTPSLAYWIWHAVCSRMEELQKKTN